MPELDLAVQNLIRWMWCEQGDCHAALCDIEARWDENEETGSKQFFEEKLAAFEDVGRALVADRWKNPTLQLGTWLDEQAMTNPEDRPGRWQTFEQVRSKIAELRA